MKIVFDEFFEACIKMLGAEKQSYFHYYIPDLFDMNKTGLSSVWFLI